MQQFNKLVDLRVDNRLSNERQGAMANGIGFMQALWHHAGQPTHFLDHLAVFRHESINQHLRVVSLPAPAGADGILVVAPAEDTLIRACQRGRCLHTLITGDAIEGMLIAPSTPAQHGLSPATQLNSTVRTHEFIALLRQTRLQRGIQHFLGLACHTHLSAFEILFGAFTVGCDNGAQILKVLQRTRAISTRTVPRYRQRRIQPGKGIVLVFLVL
mmetsp:Transcript_13788/g.20055  ORF Transcript_13788/g.20055 Transcript_13788/m.20055 type:complete len:215 (-) Transcript_13788:541-1185(-)